MGKEKRIKYIFLGATQYSKELLEHLVENGFPPSAIFAIPKEFHISYSERKVANTNYANLKEVAKQLNVPYYEVDSVPGKRLKDYQKIFDEISPDLILVLGWYYMLPKSIRNSAKFGAWGIHASLLPKYAGGAPLVWAMINGEKKTGVTLFRMDEGVDDGDIITQESFPIAFDDTIKEVYKKATEASKNVLIYTLNNIENIAFTPQKKEEIEIYPQRSPEDGEIDLSMNAEDIYNFIRAQSSPYPGAFIRTKDGRKIIIERARVE